MERLVFGTGPIALAEARQRHRRAFAHKLSEAIGTEVVVVVASAYEELSGLVARGEVHLAWLPPAVFVRGHDRGEARLLCSAVRARGSRFRGTLFVRTETPWTSVHDLRGLRVAWVDRGSCAGYLFPRLALIEQGIEPDTYFDKQFLLGSHNAVARAVAVGKADVGATFVDQLPDHAANARPERSGWALEVDPEAMRPVLFSQPIPSDTVCASSALPEELAPQVCRALLEMHGSPDGARVLLSLFGVDRFEPALAEDYEPVRRALGTVRIRA